MKHDNNENVCQTRDSCELVTVITQNTVIGKTSRRLEELEPEILHRCSIGHYATFQGHFVFPFRHFSSFFGGPSFFGDSAIHSDPPKLKKKSSLESCVMTKNVCAKFRVLTPRKGFASLCDELCRATVNRELHDFRKKMASWGLLGREHETSGISSSSFSMKLCGALAWVMRQQLVFGKLNI